MIILNFSKYHWRENLNIDWIPVMNKFKEVLSQILPYVLKRSGFENLCTRSL